MWIVSGGFLCELSLWVVSVVCVCAVVSELLCCLMVAAGCLLMLISIRSRVIDTSGITSTLSINYQLLSTTFNYYPLYVSLFKEQAQHRS